MMPGRLFLRGILLLAALLPLGALAQAEAPRIRVALAEFVKQSGDARFDFLQAAIPGMVQAGLLSDERLAILGPDEISARLDRAGLPPRTRWGQGAVSHEVAQALDADLLLEGTFVEFQGEIVINARLHRLRTQGADRLAPVSIDERRVVAGVQSLADNVLALLRKVHTGGRIRSFAVACLTDRSALPGNAQTIMRRDLALSLTGRIAARRGAHVADWSRTEPLCDKPPADEAMAKQLDVDAVIGGTINVRDDTLHVLPALYIREGGTRIEMPAVVGKLASYEQVKEELGKRVSATLDGALAKDGTWRIAELARTLKPGEDLRKGVELAAAGDLELAVLYLARAASSGEDVEAQLQLGLAQSRQKKYAEAAASLANYVKARPESVEGLRELGVAYAGQRRFDDALAQYRRAIALAPSHTGLRVDVGNAYFLKGDFEEAKRNYRQALQLSPASVASHFNIGLAAQRQGAAQDGEAIAAYRAALGLNAQYEPARRQLAGLYQRRADAAQYDRDEPDRAVPEYSESLAILPSTPAYFGRAMARSYLKSVPPDYAMVVQDYEEVMRRTTGVPAEWTYRRATLLNLAEGYILAGRYGDARDRAKSAVRELQKEPRERNLARYLLVVALLLNGDPYEAEFARMRQEIADAKDPISGWDFSLLEKHYAQHAAGNPRAADQVQRITAEFKATATEPSKAKPK